MITSLLVGFVLRFRNGRNLFGKFFKFLLDFLQRLFAEIPRLRNILFGPPGQIANGFDVGVLQTVARSY